MDLQKTKKLQRREEEKRRKREHIINILWKLQDRGIHEATARQIAAESKYQYSGWFTTLLNALADDGFLQMEVYPYRGGRCSHKYTYMLPGQTKVRAR